VGHHVKAILDTSVVIADDAIAALDGDLAISTITLAELHYGVLIAHSQPVRAERLRRLIALERTFDALPVDPAVAASYGRIAAAVTTAGRKPRGRSMDLLIAATALTHDARLYTRNPKDFRALDDLVDVVAV